MRTIITNYSFVRYRVIYFQYLCYLALPLCTVSMHLTRCMSLFPLFFLFKFLVFEAALYANKDAYIKHHRNELVYWTMSKIMKESVLTATTNTALPVRRRRDVMGETDRQTDRHAAVEMWQ